MFGVFSGSQESVVWVLRNTNIEPLLIALHTGNSIIFNLSIGCLISMFFWYLLVFIPNKKHELIIKNNLSHQYQSFKENTINILLRASKSNSNPDQVKNLLDHNTFKSYFDANDSKHWYAALNGMQEDKDFLHDILIEMELLEEETRYTLNNIKIDDQEVFKFFKRLSKNIFLLKNSKVYSYDQTKYLGNFLYCILAQWSIISGQLQEDIYQKMIDKIQR